MNDADTVTFTVGDLRRAAEKCPDVKRVLEAMKPEVFGMEIKSGAILINKELNGPYNGVPYLATLVGDEYVLGNLNFPGRWSRPWPKEDYKYSFRPMRSGTITITVREGIVAGAVVKED